MTNYRMRDRLLVAAIFVTPMRVTAQALPDAINPLEYEGCYAVEWLDMTNAAPFERLERRIWLTTLQIVSDSNMPDIYVVRPAPGEPASSFERVRWRIVHREQELVVDWDSGFHGVVMRFTIDTEIRPHILIGVAGTFDDYVRGGTTDSARVKIAEFNCLDP